MIGRGPLTGFRVVDFTENMAGPFGTMILGDQGADVIKVEAPAGDVIRRMGTSRGGMAAYFANLNRSKRSLAIDLQRQESGPILDRLLRDADVVVQSFRPPAAVRLGIDAATLCSTRPYLVHASIVGFGERGPLAGRPVYDHVIQALSGMAALQADGPDGTPRLVRHGLVDKATGYVLAQSVCAALLQRQQTGEGTSISINMLDVALAFLWPDGMMNHTVLEPDLRRPAAALTFRLTPTADGHLALVVLTDAQWHSLAEALDLDVRLGDEGVTPGELLRAARERLARMNSQDAIARLSQHDVPCAPVLDLDEVARHPQVAANEVLFEMEHPVLGPIRQPQPVPMLSETAPADLRPAPQLGQHTADVLLEIGYSSEEIARLLRNEVVAEP